MTKIKYNVSDVADMPELESAPPNVYPVKVLSCDVEKPEGKDTRIKVVVEITKPANKYYRLTDYINLESEASKFKMKQFVTAFGMKASGEFDDQAMVGKACRIKTKMEPYNDEQRAKIALWLPKDATAKADKVEKEVEKDTVEVDIDLDELGEKAEGGAPGAQEELITAGEVYGLDSDEYATWTEFAEAIKEAAEADGGDDEEPEEEKSSSSTVVNGPAADADDADAQAALTEEAEAVGLDPDDFDTWVELELAIEAKKEASEDGDADDDSGEDLEELGTLADDDDEDVAAPAQERLTELAEEKSLDPDDFDTWAELAEALGASDTDAAADYEDWGIPDLKKKAKEIGVSAVGTKEAIIARIREYDEADPFS